MSFRAATDRLQEAAERIFQEEIAAVYHVVATGAKHAVPVIFDDEHTSMQLFGGVEVSRTSPTADLRLSQLSPAPKQDDEINVRGQDYMITDVQPDGHGMVSLILTKKKP